MARIYTEMDDHLRAWIGRQAMFFVASAPLSGDGHVNVSPKGPIASLQILGPTSVAYLDIIGSGAETIAHIRENGRIVIMLCAFEGPPRIVRLHGRGAVLTPADEGFAPLLDGFPFAEPAAPEARRAIVRVEVTRIADSCGYGVPLMDPVGERPHMDAWAAKRLRTEGPDALRAYRAEHNTESIDGLPALEPHET